MDRATLRLFFALWPEAGTRSALAGVAREVARETGGRAVAAGNIHLTLAFLGERPRESVADLKDIAAGVDGAAFTLLLDDVGYWRRAGLAWLGATGQSVGLIDLQRDLVQRLNRAGIELEARPFAPHVTLARRIASIVRRRQLPAIAWQVDAFALVASELGGEGTRYQVLETWPLRRVAR